MLAIPFSISFINLGILHVVNEWAHNFVHSQHLQQAGKFHSETRASKSSRDIQHHEGEDS